MLQCFCFLSIGLVSYYRQCFVYKRARGGGAGAAAAEQMIAWVGNLFELQEEGKQKAPKENWMFFSDTSDSNHFLLETKKKTIFPSVGKCNGGECRRKWTSCSSSALQIFPSSSSSHFSLSFPPSPRFPRAVEFFSFCFENEFSLPPWTQTPSISIRIRRSSLPRLLITSTVLKQTKRKWGKV